jgi:mono/diheme cytochrome c family protein
VLRTLTMFALAAALGAAGCGSKDKDEGAQPKAGEHAEPGEAAGQAEPAAEPTAEERVARGKYLAQNVMGCYACHTPLAEKGPDLSKKYAGGLEVPEPFGTWRGPNITQDEETGIGGWTDEQIAGFIRTGKRPDGSQAAVIMPYLFYNALSDDDVDAVVAYLRTIEPIHNEVAPSDELKLPVVPAPPPKGTAPPREDKVAYGEYLATLMHCAMCHTPFGEGGKPDMSRAFAGGFPMEMEMMGEGVLFSSNITSDPETGIGSWSEEDIIRAVTEMREPDGSPIVGPMVFYAMAWSGMERADLEALAAFVKQIPPVVNEVPPSTFKPHGPPPGAP